MLNFYMERKMDEFCKGCHIVYIWNKNKVDVKINNENNDRVTEFYLHYKSSQVYKYKNVQYRGHV